MASSPAGAGGRAPVPRRTRTCALKTPMRPPTKRPFTNPGKCLKVLDRFRPRPPADHRHGDHAAGRDALRVGAPPAYPRWCCGAGCAPWAGRRPAAPRTCTCAPTARRTVRCSARPTRASPTSGTSPPRPRRPWRAPGGRSGTELGVAQGFHQIAHQVDAPEVAGAAEGPPPTAAQRISQGKAERARFPGRGPQVATVAPEV